MMVSVVLTQVLALTTWVLVCSSETISLPPFSELKQHYLGFFHFGGPYRNHDVIKLLEIEKDKDLLLHDTTALRLSYALNQIGSEHSLGTEVIRLSRYGTDSVPGKDGRQYIFHPLAFGPYFADKYGYPVVTKMHIFDAVKTKEEFRNRQGIMRVITYTQKDNEPKGHVVLWDCDGFYQARDFFYGHTLLSVEFWEAPDTRCSETSSAAHVTVGDTAESASDDTYLMSLLKKFNQRHRLKHPKKA